MPCLSLIFSSRRRTKPQTHCRGCPQGVRRAALIYNCGPSSVVFAMPCRCHAASNSRLSSPCALSADIARLRPELVSQQRYQSNNKGCPHLLPGSSQTRQSFLLAPQPPVFASFASQPYRLQRRSSRRFATLPSVIILLISGISTNTCAIIANFCEAPAYRVNNTCRHSLSLFGYRGWLSLASSRACRPLAGFCFATTSGPHLGIGVWASSRHVQIFFPWEL